MAVFLTRKQSIAVGLGLLVSFFLGSSTLIYQRSSSRIPSSKLLTREEIEGAQTSPTAVPEETIAANGTPQKAGFVLDEFHRSLVRDGRTVWEVFGTKGRYNPLTSKAEIEQPRLTLSQKNGEEVHLSSARALLTLDGSQLTKAEVFDDVFLTYKNDTTLKTSHAIYDQANDTIEIPAPVEIENEVVKITGNRLSGKIELQEFTLENGVTTLIKPRAKK